VGAQNDRTMEKVRGLLDGRERMDPFLVDFQIDEQVQALVEQVSAKYGKIDFLVHSAAFANREDLTGRFIDTSQAGWNMAIEISAYSLVKLCKALEPVMNDGASVMTMSYLGSTRAVGNYNIMGVAKAALEASVRYLSLDLGVRGIRVNTISPGPIRTVAAKGVPGLMDMIGYVAGKAPLKRAATQEDVAGTAVYLMSELSSGVTGQVIYVDSGFNIVGM
jgi:enoyl-[acyl-carrier protein] reductase I